MMNKTILIICVLFSVNVNAGWLSAIGAAASGVSDYQTTKKNKAIDSYNTALDEDEQGNYKKALELYIKACDGKVYNGCLNAGVCYYNGKQVDENEILAAIFFKKACDGGIERACFKK